MPAKLKQQQVLAPGQVCGPDSGTAPCTWPRVAVVSSWSACRAHSVVGRQVEGEFYLGLLLEELASVSGALESTVCLVRICLPGRGLVVYCRGDFTFKLVSRSPGSVCHLALSSYEEWVLSVYLNSVSTSAH